MLAYKFLRKYVSVTDEYKTSAKSFFTRDFSDLRFVKVSL